jgi:hypothetical protein
VIDEKSEFLAYYADVDSQRIREAFFDTPNQPPLKESPDIKKNPLLFTLFLPVAIMLILAVLFANYDIIVVKRKKVSGKPQSLSLINNHSLDRIASADLSKTKLLKSAIFLYAGTSGGQGIKIDFMTPLDISGKTLTISLKNPGVSVKIFVVVKDTRFFSNALAPLVTIARSENESGESRASIEFGNKSHIQNASLNKIRQIVLYFAPQINEKEMGLLIKELSLADSDVVLNTKERR